MALTLPSPNSSTFLNLDSITASIGARAANNQYSFGGNTSFNGSGLTRTTSTLTPTRLCNIEHIFGNDPLSGGLNVNYQQYQHMAGFVPPNINISLKPNQANLELYNQTFNNSHSVNIKREPDQFDYNEQDSNNNNQHNYPFTDSDLKDPHVMLQMLANSNGVSSEQLQQQLAVKSSKRQANNTMKRLQNKAKAPPSNSQPESSSSQTIQSSAKVPAKASAANGGTNKRKATGGRKPTKNDKLTPEEEERIAKRRERNKEAAARCRKRRMDRTNELLIITSGKKNENLKLIEQLHEKLKSLETLYQLVTVHQNKCPRSSMAPLISGELHDLIDYGKIQRSTADVQLDSDQHPSNLSSFDAENSMSSSNDYGSTFDGCSNQISNDGGATLTLTSTSNSYCDPLMSDTSTASKPKPPTSLEFASMDMFFGSYTTPTSTNMLLFPGPTGLTPTGLPVITPSTLDKAFDPPPPSNNSSSTIIDLS